MTDAGFFRGTSADQDNRFANKQKKLLKEFSPILNTKLNMSKIDIESLKPWIELKIKEVLEKDDEILSDSIYEHLAGKEPDGKDLLTLITGLVEDNDQKASKFMEELWTKLIDLQENSNGLNADAANNAANTDTHASPGNGISASPDSKLAQPQAEDAGDSSHGIDKPVFRRSRTRSRSPRSPQAQEDESSSKAADQRSSPEKEQASPHQSQKGSAKSGSRSASKSRSHSRSSHSRSGRSSSRSKSRSNSRSYSRSRSASRSPRRSKSRSRSPYRQPHNRFRRSHSRSDSFHPRSRSPRGGRGGFRGGYRGYGYQDRRRGPMGPIRRRPSPPWGRRRYSPRSPPLRRRRTPSVSPRRRSRSPPPYRRRSRSRSPLPHHMMGRRSPPPRSYPMGASSMDLMVSRHVPHHDMHRPIVPPPPLQRSPRGIDHRGGYSDRQMLPRHSPIVSRPHDLRHPSHSLASAQPGPSKPYSSPSSSPSERKKHKKDKKHRKHKKSKKHRSASPEKRKKHKKHKKNKKHKS